jgi:hypothetical protein
VASVPAEPRLYALALCLFSWIWPTEETSRSARSILTTSSWSTLLTTTVSSSAPLAPTLPSYLPRLLLSSVLSIPMVPPPTLEQVHRLLRSHRSAHRQGCLRFAAPHPRASLTIPHRCRRGGKTSTRPRLHQPHLVCLALLLLLLLLLLLILYLPCPSLLVAPARSIHSLHHGGHQAITH